MNTIEHLLGLIGIHKCHWCKKYVLPWQKFVGYSSDNLNTGFHIDWITHAGECTYRDIQREESREK